MVEDNRMEMIGFHKGSITTLANERRELAIMIGNVDKLIAAHIKALQEMGVKIVGDAPAEKPAADPEAKKAEALEDLLK
jgi:hypothetical protein